MKPPCTLDGCERPQHARGWCNAHCPPLGACVMRAEVAWCAWKLGVLR